MGIFDSITDLAFVEIEEDKTLFFPWGGRTSGFIVNSEDALIVRQFHKTTVKMTFGFFTLIVFISPLFLENYVYTVPVVGAYLGIYWLRTRKITKDLTRTSIQKPLGPIYSKLAIPKFRWLLVFAASIWNYMLYEQIAKIISGSETIADYILTGLCGLFAAYFTILMVKSFKHRVRDENN